VCVKILLYTCCRPAATEMANGGQSKHVGEQRDALASCQWEGMRSW